MSSLNQRIQENIDQALKRAADRMVANLNDRIAGIEYHAGAEKGYKKYDGNDIGEVGQFKNGDLAYTVYWWGDDVKYIEYGYGLRGAGSPHPDNPYGAGAGAYGQKWSWFYPQPDEETGKPYSRSYGHKGSYAPFYQEVQALKSTISGEIREAINRAVRGA